MSNRRREGWWSAQGTFELPPDVAQRSGAGGLAAQYRFGARSVLCNVILGSALICLGLIGDQPGIAADVIALLVQAFQTSGRGIVVPIHGGRRGHPLLISMHYRDEILNCYQDVGLRGLLHAHPEDVFEVEVAAPDVIEDMDVPEDYERAVSVYRKKLENNGLR